MRVGSGLAAFGLSACAIPSDRTGGKGWMPVSPVLDYDLREAAVAFG